MAVNLVGWRPGLAEVIFFIAAIGAVGGALGTVLLRNPFYSVLSLVFHLLSLAALFLLLRAEFVAAAQVIVYAGAVMVLYVFVVAYIGGDDQALAGPTGPGLRTVSLLFALVLFVELSIALIGTGLTAIEGDGASVEAGFGTPAAIGELFLTRFLIAFEGASVLLLIAAVGAVILARRRAGLEDVGELSVSDLVGGRDGTLGEAPTESMLEAGGPPRR
jgi:NADH:ubiquinone oxidoreductase subunit 6 (subunit J)